MFKGGQSNPTYKLVTPSQSYVMRAKPGPVAKLLPSAHAVEREFAVMRGLAGTDVPVPRMYCLCEDEAVIGRAFYVMEFMQGRVLWDQSLPGMNTAAARRDLRRDEPRHRGAAHREVRRARPRRLRQARQLLRSPDRPLEQAVRRLRSPSPIPEMDKLIEWLPAHIPASARDESQVSIVHGDYRLDNLMFHATEPRVIAVLDWELSTLGHPLADFSYHCMAWHIPHGAVPRHRRAGPAAWASRPKTNTSAATASAPASPRPQALKADWNFYLAYNLFRIAAILQGIAKRVEAGTASSAQAVASGAGARPMAELAWHFAQQA